MREKHLKTQGGDPADFENSCSLFRQGHSRRGRSPKPVTFTAKTPASNLGRPRSEFSPSAKVTDRASVQTRPVVWHQRSLPGASVSLCRGRGAPKPGGVLSPIWVCESSFDPFLRATVVPVSAGGLRFALMVGTWAPACVDADRRAVLLETRGEPKANDSFEFTILLLLHFQN